MYLMARKIKSMGIKMVLSGEGADEIFGGYVRYLPIAREWYLRKKFPSYNYIFGKFYRPYLEGFSRICLLYTSDAADE